MDGILEGEKMNFYKYILSWWYCEQYDYVNKRCKKWTDK